ncbi:MAG: hypothetical protein LBF63_04120, partial [Treponema sp.]|nr:hypothetical protein [Treponema sp.]
MLPACPFFPDRNRGRGGTGKQACLGAVGGDKGSLLQGLRRLGEIFVVKYRARRPYLTVPFLPSDAPGDSGNYPIEFFSGNGFFKIIRYPAPDGFLQMGKIIIAGDDDESGNAVRILFPELLKNKKYVEYRKSRLFSGLGDEWSLTLYYTVTNINNFEI